ncbi:MAG: hypothetical protein U0271_05810 [Polyangiaceae bacterium]
MVLFAPEAPFLYCRLEGSPTEEILEPLLAACNRAVSSSRGWFFNDWELFDRYTSRGRLALTTWALRNRQKIAASHVLVGSKLVAMGVEVANLALGGIYRTHTERARFHAELQRTAKELDLKLPPLFALQRGSL